MDPLRFLMILEDKIRKASAADKKQMAAIVGQIISHLRDSAEDPGGGAD